MRPWLRSIRLDVFAIDQRERIYNTESQKEKKNTVTHSEQDVMKIPRYCWKMEQSGFS